MYMRRPVENELDIEDLKAQISLLKSEISAPDVETSENEIGYDDVIKVLEKENASLKEFIEFQTKKKEKLTEEGQRISKHIEEDENIISVVNDYMTKNVLFAAEEVADTKTELFFKMEVLHRKLCRLIKKFSHVYLSGSEESDLSGPSNISAEAESAKTAPKKSFLDILKLLIFELGATDACPILEVDDTIEDKHIEFLLSAGIIERCTEDPNCVKLKISEI